MATLTFLAGMMESGVVCKGFSVAWFRVGVLETVNSSDFKGNFHSVISFKNPSDSLNEAFRVSDCCTEKSKKCDLSIIRNGALTDSIGASVGNRSWALHLNESFADHFTKRAANNRASPLQPPLMPSITAQILLKWAAIITGGITFFRWLMN